MRKLVVVFVVLFSASVVFAQGDLHLFDVDNKKGSISSLSIEKVLSENGFTIGLRSEMIKPFKIQFKQTDFKSFTLLTVYHTKLSRELVLKYSDAGVITPMGVGIYQRLNEDTLHVSLLTSQTQAKILGIQNNKILKGIEADLLKAIKKAMPEAHHKYSKEASKQDAKLMTRYVLELDEEDEGEPGEILEDLEVTIETEFKPFGFIVPASKRYNEVLTKGGTVESPYDFYKTYSICKLKVIYTVAKTRPDAAAFAPCTTMMYKKKGEHKVVVGFPSVYNWISSVNVENEEAKSVLLHAQESFESILIELTE